MPVHPRRPRTHQPRLVAGCTEHRDAPSESKLSDPMGKDFDYAKEFKSLDLNAVIKDLTALMTDRKSGGRPTSVTTAAF